MIHSLATAIQICVRIALEGERAQLLRICWAVCISILVVALSTTFPLILKFLIDGVSADFSRSHTVALALAYGIAWVASELMIRAQAIITMKAVEGIRSEVSLRYMTRVLRDVAPDSSVGVGEHMEKQYQLENACVQFIDGVIFQIFPLLARIGFSFALVFISAGALFAFLLLATMLTFILILYLTSAMVGERHQASEHSAQLAARRFVDILRNAFTVRALATEQQEISELREKLNARANAAVASIAIAQWVGGAQIVALGIGLTITTILSAIAVGTNAISVGDFVQLNAYLLQFVLPASYFSYVISGVQKSSLTLTSHGREIFFRAADASGKAGFSPPAFPSAPEVELINLSVKNGDRFILRNINMKVPGGSTVAVVGSSGAGKSTLLQSIIGLQNIVDGNVRVDGENLSSSGFERLRKKTGYGIQGNSLFDRTFEENVMYGGNAEIYSMEKIIDLANLSDISILDKSAGFIISNGESGLSEGEKERIVFARAISRGSRLLLLDEPTSSLDAVAEAKLMSVFFRQLEGVTRFIVSHRLSTIACADLILVLQGGEAVESGTHQELMDLDGIYASMWNLQMTAEI